MGIKPGWADFILYFLLLAANALASCESFKWPGSQSVLVLISILVLSAPCLKSATGIDVEWKTMEEPTHSRTYSVFSASHTCIFVRACRIDTHITSKLTTASLVSAGCTPQLLPNHLRRAAANVHRAGGGRVCERNSGEHAQHCPHWAVNGCGDATVHCQDCGQPPVFFLR